MTAPEDRTLAGRIGTLLGADGAAASSFLGEPSSWPQSLRTVLGLLLAAEAEIVLFWGPDYVAFYNAAYAPTIGTKHPRAFGRPARENWAELWHDLGPLLDGVRATGETVSAKDRPFRIERHGYMEDVFFDISYSAVPDEAGAVGGVLCIVAETTKRVLGERQLRESEARFQATANSIDQMIWATRPDGFHDYYNDRWYEFTGVPHGSTDGEAWNGMFHPDDQERAWRVWRHSLDTGEPYQIEYRLRHRSGEYRWVLGRAQAARDAAGGITRWFGTCTDIHEIKLADERRDFLLALNDRTRGAHDAVAVAATAAEMLGRATGAARVGYGEIDAAEKVVRVEHDWTRDATVASLAGEARPLDAFGEAVVGELRAGRTLVVADCLEDGRVSTEDAGTWNGIGCRSLVVAPIMKDGALRSMLYVHEPEPRRWTARETGLVEDVAQRTWEAIERARVEAELRELNATLERRVDERTRERDRVWQTTNDLMGTAGVDGYMKTVNPAWTTMLGWSAEEVLSHPFAAIIDPADHAATADVVRRLAKGETVTGFVDRVRGKDGGYRTVMWTAVPEAEKSLFHIVGRDISEQRRMEEQLRQSQKMEAVGQLTGGLAHDFNNLLAGISGSLELLQARVSQGRIAEVERYALAAQGAAKRAAALTHRLLAFSRRQTLDPKPTDVNRLVTGMEELIRRTVGPAIELETVATGGLWPTLVDPNQLENALLNLCINARDAMPDGGRLTIETANRWLDDRTAGERDLPAGQYVSMCVSDNGTGMTPDVVERAFDPFFTTKPIGVGTGLGLSMIYGFARQSGGQVRIYSEPGRGTMVCLYLPRHHDAGEVVAEPRETAAGRETAEAGETVLVIDDEPLVRMLVVDVLEELGYAAIEAGDGPTGLKVLQSDARVDLLITDVGLPNGMNGRQVADAARNLRPGLKVLFVTGYAENAVLSHGHLEPGMHVVTKPFAMDALAKRIKKVISADG